MLWVLMVMASQLESFEVIDTQIAIHLNCGVFIRHFNNYNKHSNVIHKILQTNKCTCT